MRDIKFRCWDAKGTFNKGIPCMHKDVTGSTIFDYIWHSDEFPKMQWTGLNDSKGVPIYEGDILDITDDADIFMANGKVEWLHDFWNVSKIEDSLYSLTRNGYVEVIGNIYENPELINS